MSETIERLDYTKAPPGYRLVRDVDGFLFIDASGKRHASAMHNLGGDWREDFALSRAWTHYKREHDPPHLHPNDSSERMAAAFSSPVAEWRASGWIWHDRRHALAEHDKRRCSRVVPFSEYLAMTDADCKLAEFLVADAERRAELRRLSAMTMQSCSEEDPEVGALIEAHARDKAAQERYADS